MDQIKIVKFIAERRKAEKFTQRQLAEKLSISDKTVSKWECGNGLPDVSLMMPLCGELHISVNELLSGEKLSENEYYEKAEENMMELIKEKQETKRKLAVGVVAAVMGISTMVVCIVLADFLSELSTLQRILLVTFGIVNMALGIGIAVWSEMTSGAFQCTKCGEKFVPDVKSYIMGAHTITRRSLKCPHCGVKNYCKRTLTRK